MTAVSGDLAPSEAAPDAPADPAASRSAANAVPARTPGTRSRGGNAMARTRAALLVAAVQCVEKYGLRRTTMGDIATVGRIAKATLYNHFRTKEDLYAAVVEAEVSGLADEAVVLAAAEGLQPALSTAAVRISDHGALRRIAREDPLVLARLVTVSAAGPWAVARAGVTGVLEAAEHPATPDDVELVLRWLLSHVGLPATPDQATAGATRLCAALERTQMSDPPETLAAVDRG